MRNRRLLYNVSQIHNIWIYLFTAHMITSLHMHWKNSESRYTKIKNIKKYINILSEAREDWRTWVSNYPIKMIMCFLPAGLPGRHTASIENIHVYVFIRLSKNNCAKVKQAQDSHVYITETVFNWIWIWQKRE